MTASLFAANYISIHPPRGGEGREKTKAIVRELNFNPPSPWGGGTNNGGDSGNSGKISIHPPRGGEGLMTNLSKISGNTFQSTLPVGGRDEAFWMIIFVASRFQSTLPVGGRDTSIQC